MDPHILPARRPLAFKFRCEKIHLEAAMEHGLNHFADVDGAAFVAEDRHPLVSTYVGDAHSAALRGGNVSAIGENRPQCRSVAMSVELSVNEAACRGRQANAKGCVGKQLFQCAGECSWIALRHHQAGLAIMNNLWYAGDIG